MQKLTRASVTELLIFNLFKEFYRFNFILNGIVGAMAYDWLMKEHPFEIPKEYKEILWAEEKIRYHLGHRNGIQLRSKEWKWNEKELHEYYKCRLLEYHLRELLHEKGITIKIVWDNDRSSMVEDKFIVKDNDDDKLDEERKRIFEHTKQIIALNQLEFEILTENNDSDKNESSTTTN